MDELKEFKTIAAAELLSCPFCGERPKYSERADAHTKTGRIYIVSCMCNGFSAHAHQHADTYDDVKEAWNRRTQPTEQAQPVAITDAQIDEIASKYFHYEDDPADYIGFAREILRKTAPMPAAAEADESDEDSDVQFGYCTCVFPNSPAEIAANCCDQCGGYVTLPTTAQADGVRGDALEAGQIVCPDCEGKKEIEILFDHGSAKCDACDGEGKVWPDDYAAYDDARSGKASPATAAKVGECAPIDSEGGHCD